MVYRLDLISFIKVKCLQPTKNAYVNFTRDFRLVLKTRNPDMSGKAITAELSNAWKTLDTAAKQKYIDQAAPFKMPKKVYYF